MTTLVPLIAALFHLLGALSSVHAVMANRTAQGAIAWGIGLNTFPYFVVPYYWIFGRSKFHGYAEVWRGRQAEIEALINDSRAALAPYVVEQDRRSPAYEALERIARSRLLGANQVNLLVDGTATFASIFDGIARAEHYVLVQFYIVHDDSLGQRLKAAMIDCVKRGVEVYFLYDEIGCHNLPRAYLRKLDAAGVHQSEFHSTRGRRNRFQINFRNHRKSVIIDGHECWVGGHNVGDEYLGLDEKIGPWRDTHVHIVGPAAQHAQLVFLADWYWAMRTVPKWNWQPRAAVSAADVNTMVIPISPTHEIETAQLFFVHALNTAQKRIWIATPYFIPDQALMAALRLAGLRGVDVRIIIPDKSDNIVVDYATLWFAEQLCDVGIRFYRHVPGFMHQKVFLLDDQVSTVGSANFDNRSFRLQFEINAVFIDESFAKQIEDMLKRDLERCRAYDPRELREASFAKRLGASAARLMAPLL